MPRSWRSTAARFPETLLESQLFRARARRVHTACSNQAVRRGQPGTLFLDEIGEMPPPLQVKLLRVIEDKYVLPVGGTKTLPIDTRIIASTNRDLEHEVEAGRFREDLFLPAQRRAPHRSALARAARRPSRCWSIISSTGSTPSSARNCLGVERDALWSLIGRPWKAT